MTLASDRGLKGAPGGLIRSDTFATSPLIRVTGADARVTGLRLQGPNPRQCLEHHSRAFREGHGGHGYYYKFPTSDGIETREPRLRVDNCELAGWSHGAVYLAGGDGHRVQHCFIHHNQYQGLGYGVSHDRAESLIEGNLFDANRHSIAGSRARRLGVRGPQQRRDGAQPQPLLRHARRPRPQGRHGRGGRLDARPPQHLPASPAGAPSSSAAAPRSRP